MQTGIISKLFYDGEYGKIRTSNGEDAHFHKGCLWDIPFAELIEGQGVEFEIQPTYKGHLAFNIRRREQDDIFVEAKRDGGRDAKRKSEGI